GTAPHETVYGCTMIPASTNPASENRPVPVVNTPASAFHGVLSRPTHVNSTGPRSVFRALSASDGIRVTAADANVMVAPASVRISTGTSAPNTPVPAVIAPYG